MLLSGNHVCYTTKPTPHLVPGPRSDCGYVFVRRERWEEEGSVNSVLIPSLSVIDHPAGKLISRGKSSSSVR